MHTRTSSVISLLIGLSFTVASPAIDAKRRNKKRCLHGKHFGKHHSKRHGKHCKKKKVTYLSQADFADGTVQLTKPGLYRLTENISFNPHPPGSVADDGTILDAYTGGLPFRSQFGTEPGQYDPAAFGIGFFAAITIAGKGIELDLNGFTIEQSATHALLQRFFAVIELADQPFIPAQGPSDFGDELVPATNTIIRNGTIGRSSHHGIHGNGNRNITVKNVDFTNYEVAALALNGVNGLKVTGSNAENREDVPVLGTFSNARFISAYVDWLVQTNSPTELSVQGVALSANDIQTALRTSINNVYEDVILDGDGYIDPVQHPEEYALFHNPYGIVDGNSYGFLVNPLGAAVGGFPSQPDKHARNVVFRDVHINSQKAFVNEVVALQQDGNAAIDPVGAVFMVRNVHPDTGTPVTVTSLDEATALYTGNVLSNAQALVAKAAMNDEFPSFLDVSRTNITPAILDWIETQQTLSALVQSPSDYLCNGDTMFHVNKGVIGFKMDGVKHLKMKRTSAKNIENIGTAGSAVCGNYQYSHPQATQAGYGGAKVRGYSFAGSEYIGVSHSKVKNVESHSGTIVGFDIMTDTLNAQFVSCTVSNIDAGVSFTANGGPNTEPDAIGFQISNEAQYIDIRNESVRNLNAFNDSISIRNNTP